MNRLAENLMWNVRQFFLTVFLLLIAVPAFAYDLQGGMEGVIDGLLNGLIQIAGIVVLAIITRFAHGLTKKYKLEQYNDQIDRAVMDAVLYAEEWGRRKAKDSGVAVTGAEKFARAYQKASEKLPMLDSEVLKEKLVVGVADLRDRALEALEERARSQFQ